MMDNEDYIRERIGKDNPFHVPDGYFDDLASRIMARLPEDDAEGKVVRLPHRHRGLRAILYTAACLCFAVFGAAAYLSSFSKGNEKATNQTVTVANANITNADASVTGADSYVEDVADYTMMDNSDIYAYLASE